MTNEADIGVQMNDFRRDFASLRDALEEALVGQREAIEILQRVEDRLPEEESGAAVGLIKRALLPKLIAALG